MAESVSSVEETAVEIFVTFIDSPCKFFVVNGEKLELLDKIRVDIESALREMGNISWTLPAELNVAFAPCVSMWQGRWYRARVLSRRSDGKYEVEYVDYGNIETVEASHIKQRPPGALINKADNLASPCRLSGDGLRMNKARFDEITARVHGRYRMRLDDVDEDTGQYIVTLYCLDGDRYRSVNDAITEVSMVGNVTGSLSRRHGPASPNETTTIQGIPSPIMQPPAPFKFLGPMGARKNFVESIVNKSNPIGVPELNNNISAEIAYPLVDLSEPRRPPAAVAPVRPAASISVRQQALSGTTPLANFVCDLEAVLDGPAEDSDSDEEQDDVPAYYMAGSSHQQSGMATVNTSESGLPGGVDDEMVKALKQKWSTLLSLRYGPPKPPAPGSLSSEQQVTIKRIISPTEFYAQTVQQTLGLGRLETSMADVFQPNTQPIPAQLLSRGLCCAVYSELSKTWRRGQVVNVITENDRLMVDVHLVDTGYERRFEGHELKPITAHFTAYLPLVFFVKLQHPYFESIRWRPEDTDTFRRMVEGRTLIMKFMTNSLPVSEVELLDMTHTCPVCATREKKCTVNERLVQWIQRNGGFGTRM